MSSPTVPPSQPFTVIEPWRFEVITPGQFITFNVQNPIRRCRLLHFPVLRVAVLDSPIAKGDDESPLIAAMVVPENRETDWIFCTESGHIQLIFKFPRVSRLILIGNMPPYRVPSIYKLRRFTDTDDGLERLENELKPLLRSLHPKVSSNNDWPGTISLMYDQNDVVYRVTVTKLVGPIVGEFLVEDVDLLCNTARNKQLRTDRNKQLRRRLRFKRSPNLIQSEVLIIPIIPDDEATTQTDLECLRNIENAKFEADTSILVHQYLNPMVAGLFLIASHLNEEIQEGYTPRALCLGIGGGVLLSFLDTEMGFEITGVEADEIVLMAAKKYFGFSESGSIRVIVGDAIEIIQNLPEPEGDTDESEVDEDVPDAEFDVIFVDLDSSEAKNGFSAPPLEFVEKPVLEDLRSILDDHGVLIMNVIPLNDLFYTTLVKELKKIFHKVYTIDVGDQVNFVVMATVLVTSSNDNDNDNEFLKKLKSMIPGTYMDSIVEL